jgi:2-C-methyl-D-erythritol 4-phosphate cytidylyltransferase
MGIVTAIVLAAGVGERMGYKDKAMVTLMGDPLIAHTLRPFQQCSKVDQIILIMHPDKLDQGRTIVTDYKFDKVIGVYAGGGDRQESAFIGLDHSGTADIIIIHDGARPCVDQSIIIRGLIAVTETGAAVAAVPIRDTIKDAGEKLEIHKTVSRDHLWAAQTPQVFYRELLLEAHLSSSGSATDDAFLVESLPHPVNIFEGSPTNIKVTTTEDLELAEAILARRVT